MKFKYKEMRQSDIAPLRRKLWEENERKCPVLNQPVDFEKTHLDHLHKAKNDKYSFEKGPVRTTLDGNVNMFFGKLENAYLMNGLHKKIDLITLLERGIEYLKSGAYIDGDGYCHIHPKEVTKRKKVGKAEYNRVSKYYLTLHPKKRTVIKKPVYVTDDWEALVELTNNYINKIKASKIKRKTL